MSRLVAVVSLIAGFALSMSAAHAEPQPVTDIRVLVDVSGSMQQTDPDNLRRPALKLLFGLSPEDARVGMWSFAKFTNMQLKPEFASKAWKTEARKIADTVHSRGQRTNIEDVLRRSTWDWQRADPDWSRHMILLTDGMVDVSRDPFLNKASRKRIIEEIIPKLKAGGVRVHTVALSDKADHELLQELSRKTDGWYERVDGSEGLQRIFLRMFEKASPGDTLPIKENKFSIDKSITDMTLLIFRNKDAVATQIRQPDGLLVDDKNKSEKIEWHREQNYDLITVKKPAVGEWTILADADPDNRVRVLTNLRLLTKELPNNILFGEAFSIHAVLQENNKNVEDEEFLNVVDFSADTENAQKDIDYHYALLPDNSPVAEKGAHSRKIDDLPAAGVYELVVTARGETFSRSKRHTIKLHDLPVSVDVMEKGDALEVTAVAVKDIFTKGSVKLAIVLPGGISAPQWMAEAGENKWRYVTDKAYPGEQAGIIINGTLENNTPYEHMIDINFPGEKSLEPIKPVNLYIQPVTILNPEMKNHVPLPKVVEDSLAPGEEDMKNSPSESAAAADEQPVPNEHGEKNIGNKAQETNWWVVGSFLLFLNVATFAGSVMAYKFWRRKSARVELVLEEDDDITGEDEGNMPVNTVTGESIDSDHSGELSADVAAALEGVEVPSKNELSEEDFSSMRRVDVEKPPVVLDEEDIPDFEVDDAMDSVEKADSEPVNSPDGATKPE